MKQPVWRFERERMTDAPFEVVRARLAGDTFEELRQAWGAEERIRVQASAEGERTHLKLEATLKGWGGFLRVPFFTWRVDHYLDRFVESL